MSDQSDLIVKLADMAAELRQLITDAHAATKDLRSATAEYKKVLDTAAQSTVDERIDLAVSAGLAKYESTIKEAMNTAVAKVNDEFTKLANIYLTGSSTKTGPESLHDVAMKARRFKI